MFRRFIAASFLNLVTKISSAKLTPVKIPLAGLGIVFLAMGLPVSAAADGTVTLEITGCIHPLSGCTVANPTSLGNFSAIVVYKTADRIVDPDNPAPPEPGFGVNYPMATVTFDVIGDGQPAVTNTMMFVDFADDCCAGGPLTDSFAVSDNQIAANWGTQTLFGGNQITNLIWQFGHSNLNTFDGFEPDREFVFTQPFLCQPPQTNPEDERWCGGGGLTLTGGPNNGQLGFEDLTVTFLSFVADTEDGPLAIDIMPGSFPNSINLGLGGAIPVAILGSATLDVNDIDITSLVLSSAMIKTVGTTERLLCSLDEDVSGDFDTILGLEGAPDGFLDLVCHFLTVNLVPEVVDTTTQATLSGNLNDGTMFEATDSVNIVP